MLFLNSQDGACRSNTFLADRAGRLPDCSSRVFRRTDRGGIKTLYQSVAEFGRNRILGAENIRYVLLRLKRVINLTAGHVIELCW